MFRKTLFIVSILILMNASYSVAAEVEDFFVLANDAYRQGDYAQAIKGYTEITNEGFESSSVYFNLGNAYTKDDNLGRAILSYERALWIDPRDADINANYKYVLSQAQVNRSGSDENMLLKSIDGHIKFYSINEMFIISCLSSFCIFVV
ncbi:MAG: tetratricopeptide (TPR) repeat protein, partial [Lysobacterales bacterium]